ncbi:hypothetical protein FE257_001042 [Aspergillus nanangensis]|uniref:FAD-binding domain-containing protein n=1 Tax=Aspergillus nanangensis TaxID=2582783 RepID=A0AAD4CTX4_ASPNN|nr:hypothetical protein FE257_001042 [Aspergillus nanangensis]
MGQFKVLIAGGSLVGLTLALALEHAGIEYELFEKGDFAPQLGASIGLHPHSLRILEQLGVWKDIEKEIVPLRHRLHFDGDGRCFEDSTVLKHIQEILGRPIIFMERCKALEILHSHIKDKSKLHDRNAITSYEETDEGVVITTQDGLTHHGHILIGADGIHSRVRDLMAKEIGKTNVALSQDITEGAFTSEYKCIFAVSRNDPAKPFMADATVHNVYYDNHSAIAASGVPGLVFWFLFVKTPLTRTPNCPRFTEDDADAVIEEYRTVSPGPGYTVKDLWDARVKGTLAPLEEGVLKQWSHNRVLLMGDAIHKVTINPGLGGNLAYEGIARFTNGLVSLLTETPTPSQSQLTELFARFDEGQRPRAEMVNNLSGQITRYEAQDTWFLKFASRHLSPWVSDKLKAKAYAAFSKKGPCLEYLPLPEADLAKRMATEDGEIQGMSLATILGGVTVATGLISVLWQTYRSNI